MKTDRCSSRTLDIPSRVPFVTIKKSESFDIKLPSRDVNARVTIQKTSTRTVISNANTKNPVRFKPTKGRFVVVNLRVHNAGNKTFKAGLIAGRIGLRQSGKVYSVAGRCPVAAVYAAVVGVARPRDSVRKGEIRTVGAIYVVPSGTAGLEALVLGARKKVILKN